MRIGRRRKGISLLEVILAVAILGGSMVVIGHGFFLGYRSVRNARMIGTGNRLADSAMAELAAGVIEPNSVGSSAFQDEPNWSYSIDIEDAEVPGLLTAMVTVENTTFRPNVSVTLTRLMVDPNYDPLEAKREE